MSPSGASSFLYIASFTSIHLGLNLGAAEVHHWVLGVMMSWRHTQAVGFSWSGTKAEVYTNCIPVGLIYI